MLDYRYIWSKETEGGFICFPYSLEVTAKMPAEDLWKEWEQCHVDATKCWLWPTQYSRPRLLSPARNGARFVLEYKMPNFSDPSKPLTDITYDYEMVEWNPEEMHCRYEAIGGHIFRGGGEMKITAIEKNLCNFKWGGRYLYATEGKTPEKIQKMEFEFANYFNTFLMRAAFNIQEKTRKIEAARA